MPLNPPSGNMYPWACTWNPIGGRCLHRCVYCYVPRFVRRGLRKYAKDPHLVTEELKTPLIIPDDKVLFVCSCYDLFGGWVPEEWINQVLGRCRRYRDTTFLFQTKNPTRLYDFSGSFPRRTVLGTTLETNRESLYEGVSEAPSPRGRWTAILNIKDLMPIMHSLLDNQPLRWMVSIEPIMGCDVDVQVSRIKAINPIFVSIGADSGNNNLTEPPLEKVEALITELRMFTEVRIKKNLLKRYPYLWCNQNARLP